MKATMFETVKDYIDYITASEHGVIVIVKGKHHLGLGDELRRLRKERGWSQLEMTRHTGMPQAKISRLELGKGNPTLETIRKLADALGVRIEIRLVEST